MHSSEKHNLFCLWLEVLSNDGATGMPFWSTMQEKGVGMSPGEVTL